MTALGLLLRLLVAFHGVHGVAYWGPQGGDDPVAVWQGAQCQQWHRVNVSFDVCR